VFFGPISCCWIALFALNVPHLAERVFFAGYAKQQRAERNSSNAVAEEKSHNALAQLSASGAVRKTKARTTYRGIGPYANHFVNSQGLVARTASCACSKLRMRGPSLRSGQHA
jgi:hypothetical protein